jgi:hypothetical protein
VLILLLGLQSIQERINIRRAVTAKLRRESHALEKRSWRSPGIQFGRDLLQESVNFRGVITAELLPKARSTNLVVGHGRSVRRPLARTTHNCRCRAPLPA